MKGTVTLRSTTDPQAATIRFDRGAVVVGPGSDDGASLVIETDMSGSSPGTPPRVKGALRHPILAVVTGRLLNPPPPQKWKEVVESVWNELPGADLRPDSILVRCTDRAEDLNLGGGDRPPLELHGSASTLIRVFEGDQHLAEAVESGQLQVVADLPALSVLSGAMLRHAMGERGDLDGAR